MSSLFAFKLLALISILFLTLFAGLLPLRFAARNKRVLHLGDAFASGIFLSAALLDLLPDAEAAFGKIYSIHSYPFAQLFCVITFLCLLIMEKSVAICQKKFNFLPENSRNISLITPLILIAVLSIHSLIEGAAIGIGGNFAETLIIFLAVIVHKGSESLALSSNLYRYSIALKNIGRIIFIFSWMTPLGILSASFMAHVLNHGSNQLLEALFNSIAAGTFLYLGTVHIMECEESFKNFGEMAALICGIIVMSIATIWV